MAIVTLEKRGTKLAVRSPYSALFVSKAKEFGGKWDGEDTTWTFDIRDEARVKDLCVRYYGSDGVTDDVCTLRVAFTRDVGADACPFTVFGRVVARARGRDSGAKLGDGVICLAGRARSGGSVKNWQTVLTGGTVVLIRDFPRARAEELAAQPGVEWAVFSVEPEAVPVDIPALRDERAGLAARIAEIDAIIAAAYVGNG